MCIPSTVARSDHMLAPQMFTMSRRRLAWPHPVPRTGCGHARLSLNMATSEVRIDDYNRFDAASYLRSRFTNPEEKRNQFYLHCFHEFYQQYHTQWDTTVARLLEFGGGPVIVPLISAVPFVSEIVFCEYSESGRKEVQLWKDSDPNAHNWMPYFKYVVNKLEGNVDSQAATVRECTLRSRIHRITFSDINADEIILGDKVPQEHFDIISTSACLEVAVNSRSKYQESLRKLKALLKPRGLLIGVQFLGSTWWEVKDQRYSSFPLTEEIIISLIQQTGFTILEKKTATISMSETGASSMIFIVAS